MIGGGDGATVGFDDLVNDGQPQTRSLAQVGGGGIGGEGATATGGVGSVEAIKDVGQILG